MTSAQTTLHTAPGCSQRSVNSSRFSGSRARSTVDPGQNATDCNVHAPGQGSNQGCGILGPPGSFGAALNAGGGGVFAAMWRHGGPLDGAARPRSHHHLHTKWRAGR